MTILFVANRFPYPPFRGDKLKIFNLARRLAPNHRLILITFTQDQNDIENLNKLDGIFDKVITIHHPFFKSLLSCLRIFLGDRKPLQVLYFFSKKFKKKLEEAISTENPDVIHVQHLRMSQYLDALNGTPAIIDLPDAFSLYWERRVKSASNIFRKWFNKFEYQRVVKYEKILGQYQICLACSQEDILHIEKLHGFKHVRLLPNGVDLETFSSEGHDYNHNQTLLFTGNMNYAPNVDSVQYFVKDIFPLIIQKFPNTRFVIAGQKPLAIVKALASENVEVTGFVQNIADCYQSASVVVAPLRFGAGTQNKVLEALAMGVPVVCSDIGFAGLNIESGEGAFCETDTQDFANRVIELLESESLRKETGIKGMNKIRKNYDWDVLTQKLESYFKDLLHE